MVKAKYEVFHKKTSAQKSLIKKNNFTYILSLPLIDKYLKKDYSVLDIGSGAGTLALYAANKKCKVLGIDISKDAVKAANESVKNMHLKNIRFEVVDFPNKVPKGRFDFIIFTEVIEHIKDDNKAVKEIAKMLNKNGILFLSTPSKNAPLHKMGLTKKFDKRVGHLRRYSIDELESMLSKNNLKIIQTVKVEGILRNFLFTNDYAGKLVRFIKFKLSNIVTIIDNATIPLFGESNIIIVAKKV
jgi:ubiquinone biosynthesis O-methyltransferase